MRRRSSISNDIAFATSGHTTSSEDQWGIVSKEASTSRRGSFRGSHTPARVVVTPGKNTSRTATAAGKFQQSGRGRTPKKGTPYKSARSHDNQRTRDITLRREDVGRAPAPFPGVPTAWGADAPVALRPKTRPAVMNPLRDTNSQVRAFYVCALFYSVGTNRTELCSLNCTCHFLLDASTTNQIQIHLTCYFLPPHLNHHAHFHLHQLDFRDRLLRSKPHEGENILGLGLGAFSAIGPDDQMAPAPATMATDFGRVSPDSISSSGSLVLNNG